MRKSFTHYLSIIFLFLGIGSLSAENGQLLFIAEMNAGNEVPAVRSDANGLMTFLLSEDRSKVEIHGAFANITGSVTGCHIHIGDDNSNGPVAVDLTSFISGNRIKATLPIPNLFIELAVSGELYVNLHSSVFPSGEIRGQLSWRSEFMFPVVLFDDNQVPPVAGNALGLGVIRMSSNLTYIDYQIMPFQLSGPVTAAHIHAGDEMSNGRVLADLNAGDFITGYIDDQLTVLEVFFSIIDTGAYVNVHTAANPGGEIRGQISIPAFFNANAFLNGDQENPPVTTNARGYGYALVDYPNMDSLLYLVMADGLLPTAAHVHKAAAGKNGPVLAGLSPTALPGVYSGIMPISDDDLTLFFKDELYFNIHSAAHPGGEIRGQFQNNLMKAFAFDLCGDQEVPKKNIPGYGASHVAVNKANTELEYTLFATDLNGDAVSTHIHGAKEGANGSILLGLVPPNTYTAGVEPITGALAARIDNDEAYINVHTAANPAGEIRGQIRRGLSCAINVSTIESDIQKLTLVQNPVSNNLQIKAELNKFTDALFSINDVSGKQLMQQKFGLASGTNHIEIDVNELNPGFYFLNILETKGKSNSLHFIKL